MPTFFPSQTKITHFILSLCTTALTAVLGIYSHVEWQYPYSKYLCSSNLSLSGMALFLSNKFPLLCMQPRFFLFESKQKFNNYIVYFNKFTMNVYSSFTTFRAIM